jgi:4'-phosphopantetheinyl transferase
VGQVAGDAVDVRWHVGRSTDEALVAHACAVTGADAAAVRVGRLCPQCGSASHGRPWVEVPEGYAARRLEASVARSGPHVVTALADVPVGVDVEDVAAVARGWDPALVLAPDERADSDEDRARAWTRKEAALKARGTGLATPMSSVVLADTDWTDLAAPPGHVAAVSRGIPPSRRPPAAPAAPEGPAAPSAATTPRTARPGRPR